MAIARRDKKIWKEIPIPSVSASKTAEKGLKMAAVTSSFYPGLLLSPHIILNCSSKGLTLNRNRETFLTLKKKKKIFECLSLVHWSFQKKSTHLRIEMVGPLCINEESTKNSLLEKGRVIHWTGPALEKKMKRWNGARKISSTFRNDVTHVRGIEREGRWQDSF